MRLRSRGDADGIVVLQEINRASGYGARPPSTDMALRHRLVNMLAVVASLGILALDLRCP